LTEDLDEIYRRASALDPSRPSEALRRRVLEHAAALAARPRPTANRARWRPAIFGTLAAAALAGLLVVPRVFNPHAPAESADTAAPAKVPPVVAPPPLASPPPLAGVPPFASAPPLADAPSMNAAPAPPAISPPQAAARSRAIAPADASRKAASRVDAPAQSGAAAENTIASAQLSSPPTDPSAALRRAAETGDIQKLRAILGAEVRIDAPDARGRTALMLAASRGQSESVDVLLAHGADPNAADANGTTPLKAALAADRPAIAAALRRAGAR
jgi:hypothetical protein